MYSVESYPAELEQVAVLPVDALSSCAEVMALLERAPWSGEAYDRQRPEANMRTHTFGNQTLVCVRSWHSWMGSSFQLSCREVSEVTKLSSSGPKAVLVGFTRVWGVWPRRLGATDIFR